LGIVAAFTWSAPGYGQRSNEVELMLPEAAVALAVEFGSDRIAIASETSIEMRDSSGTLLHSFSFGPLPEACCIRGLAFAGGELFIARSPSWDDREGAGGTLGGLYRWAGRVDEPPVDLPVGGCTSVVSSTQAEIVATACAGAVQLWRLEDLGQPLTVRDGPASAIALNAAGTELAIADWPLTGEGDETGALVGIHVLDIVEEPVERVTIEGADAGVRQLDFLADDLLLSLDANGVILVTELGKSTSITIADNGPISDAADHL